MACECELADTDVAQITAKADLAHGAVYRHFPSKDPALAAAITSDFAKIVAVLQGNYRAGRQSCRL